MRVGYAAGNLGKSLFWTSLEYLLLFYMTDIAGIPPAIAGMIVVISLIIGGIADPIMGYWTDARSQSGYDYRPYLRWGPVGCSVTYIAIFADPFEGLAAKTAYLVLANILFRLVYTSVDVPHNALLSKMPATPQQRTHISAWRYAFSAVGGMSVALAAAPMLDHASNVGSASSFIIFAIAAGLVACLTIWHSLPLARLLSHNRSRSEGAVTIPKFIATAARSTEVVRIFALAATNALCLPLFARMAPYVAKYVVGDEKLTGPMFVVFTLGQITAMPVWNLAGIKWRKITLCRSAYLGIASLSIASLLVPLQGSVAAVVFAGIAGFLIGGLNMLIWALAPDAADQFEVDQGIRPDALFMAMLTLTQKSAIGVGSLVAGIALSLGGFAPGQLQSPASIWAIWAVAFGMPLLAAGVGSFLARPGFRRGNKN